jgi:hypothetical protein
MKAPEAVALNRPCEPASNIEPRRNFFAARFFAEWAACAAVTSIVP